MKVRVIVSVIIGGAVIAAAVLAVVLLVNIGRNVPGYYALEKYFFEGDFGKFRRDMLEWYKDIEREDGALLVNAVYYDKEILGCWKDVYENIPEEEFHYFAASPSYLEEIGVKPLDGDVDGAWQGVRLYLLPNTLNGSAAEKLKAFLTEDALKEADLGGIENGFTERREVEFLEYAPEKYYAWRTEESLPEFAEAPVFYVCTTENMTGFESESLIATGVDGYIKFKDESALERLTNKALFEKYGLNFTKANKIYK